MTKAVIDVLEAVDVDDEEREQMLTPHRTIRLRLEAAVEVPAVEEPGERIRLRQTLEGLILLLLHEARADVLCEELERLEIVLLESG